MKKVFKNSIARIKSNLAMNKLEVAVKDTVKLMKFIEDEELESQAIIISARFYKDLGNEIAGIKLGQDTESNRLIVSIIKLLNLAEKTVNDVIDESPTAELQIRGG